MSDSVLFNLLILKKFGSSSSQSRRQPWRFTTSPANLWTLRSPRSEYVACLEPNSQGSRRRSKGWRIVGYPRRETCFESASFCRIRKLSRLPKTSIRQEYHVWSVDIAQSSPQATGSQAQAVFPLLFFLDGSKALNGPSSDGN